MKKCWTIKNEAQLGSAEILLYGAIADETWWGDEATPRQFADDLAALGGKDVTVRINSGGGDVFAAHAIYNQLQNYTGNVTVRIDGLAASAATIVAMAGNKTVAGINSVIMIHNPSFGLFGYYTATEFEKMAKDLGVIKDSIIAAYKKKCNLGEKELSKLMDNETYMGANEAKKHGLIDEIDGETADMVMNNRYLVVNSVCHDLKALPHTKRLKEVLNQRKEGKQMDVLAEIKKIIGAEGTTPTQNTVSQEDQNQVGEAVKAERTRILTLDAMRNGNPAVEAIILDAKNSGKLPDEIEVYVNVIKEHTPQTVTKEEQNTNPALTAIMNLIRDNQASGVEGVKGSAADKSTNDIKEMSDATDYMAQYINQRNGVKK